MSFNENLVLGTNLEGMQVLQTLNKGVILEAIRKVASQEVTLPNLKKEFIEDMKGFTVNSSVSGEEIKSYFVIELDGVRKVLVHLSDENDDISTGLYEPLVEDVYSFVDELIDEVDFDLLFTQEIRTLNK